MKASVFIKVAMVDQMKQVADLGLWFHLYYLIGIGIRTFDIVRQDLARKYVWLPKGGETFSSGDFPQVWLYSDPEDANKNATFDHLGVYQIHVPTLFADFVSACELLLKEIEIGSVKDFTVLIPKDEADKNNEEARTSGDWSSPKPNACFVCGVRTVTAYRNSMATGYYYGLCDEHKKWEEGDPIPAKYQKK